jgi:hypothetical protein
MAKVKVRVAVWSNEPFQHVRTFTTDAQGAASADLPRTLYILRLFTRAAGHVPLFAHWDQGWLAAGRPLPGEFTFKLAKGTTIGGGVQNDDGRPVAGAKVEVMSAFGAQPPQNRATEDVWLTDDDPCRTDEQGRWTLNNVPDEKSLYLNLRVSHPDYISDRDWHLIPSQQNVVVRDRGLPSGHVSLALLRQQRSTIVMHRGPILTGNVLDWRGKPAAGAVVAWGNDPEGETPGTADLHEVRTDAQGAYRLPSLAPQTLRVAVMADGSAPDVKTIDLAADRTKLDF